MGWWAGGHVGRQIILGFDDFRKNIQYSAVCECFLVFNAGFEDRCTKTISVKMIGRLYRAGTGCTVLWMLLRMLCALKKKKLDKNLRK